MHRFISPIMLGTAVLACAQPAPDASAPAAAAVDTAAVTAAATEVWTRWSAAARAEDIPAFTGLLTENCMMDEKGLPPLASRAEIIGVLESAFKDVDVAALTITPQQTVVVSGERAHQAGIYTETLTTTGKPGANSVYGRFAAVVVKEADGQWRAAYLMVIPDSTVTTK